MTTLLDRTLKRELTLKGERFVVTLSAEGLKLTRKGHRKGVELSWEALVSGDAALAVALNASMGRLGAGTSDRARQPDQAAAGARIDSPRTDGSHGARRPTGASSPSATRRRSKGRARSR